MNFEKHLDSCVTYARQRHAWLVPAALLLVSHLVFASGGVFAGLVSVPLCYGSLIYYAKNQLQNQS